MWSPSVLQGEADKSSRHLFRLTFAQCGRAGRNVRKVWLPGCPSHLIIPRTQLIDTRQHQSGVHLSWNVVEVNFFRESFLG